MFTTYTLPQGLRVVCAPGQTDVVYLGIAVDAGTRHELPSESGMAHFTEHMSFKGTSRRSARQVISAMESVGGELNAFTGKEETVYYCTSLREHASRAIDLLLDIALGSTYPQEEMNREVEVVIDEIESYQDQPSELIFDEIEEVAFAGHPLGRNILGDKKSLRRLKREDIISFIRENYTANDNVLSSVGNLPLNTLLKYCNRYFNQPLPTSSHRVRTPFTTYHPTHIRKRKNISQAHVMLCNTAYSFDKDERVPFTILTNLLGGQALSSRLNVVIREQHGLAYSVEANYTPFSDTGLFTIYLGCDHAMIDRCIELTYKELNKFATKKLGTVQLHTAKKQFLGQLAITNEAKLNEMLSIGRSALYFNEVETTESSFQKVEAITADEILEAANRIFIPDQFSSLIYSGK